MQENQKDSSQLLLMSDAKMPIKIEDITKPPAIEAIIELKFAPPEEAVSVDIFADLIKQFEGDFPVVKNFYMHMAKLDLGQQSSSNAQGHTRQLGYNLQTAETGNYQTIWFHLDKLLVSNVGLYCGGDPLIELFERAWKAYTKCTNYKKADRLAMRYINRIEMSPDDMHKRLTVLPSLPEVDSPILINEVMCSSAIADEKLENKANLNYFFKTKSQAEDGTEKIEVFIDIDAYYQGEIDNQKWDIIRNKLESIRKFKNVFFLGSFTQDGLKEFTDENG